LERRTYNRSPIYLDAVIHDKKHRSWPFVIEDFGFDGLCLRWHNKNPLPESIKVDDLLDVKCSIEQQGENQEHHLEVKVVRLLDKGLAVTLFNPVLEAMAELSRKQQNDGLHNASVLSHSLDKKSQNTLQAIKQSFLNNLSHSTEIFLPIAHDAFFQQAEKSANNRDQARFFDSINTLNESRNNMKQQFLQIMQKHLNACGQSNLLNDQSDEIAELDLIDQNEFENWLTVNQLTINVTPHYEQELLEIKLRLARLFGIDVEKIELTPFSPEIIFKSFSEVIHSYFLNNDILLILYTQFEKVMDNYLFDMYKEINQIFIDNNVLPLIEKKKYEIKKDSSGSTKRAKDTSAQNRSQESITEKNPLAQSVSANSPQLMNSSHHMTEMNTIQNTVNLVPTYQTLKELLSFQNGQEFDKAADDFFDSDEYKQQLHILIGELSKLQSKQAGVLFKDENIPVDLTEIIQNSINKENYSAELNNEFEYTFDIIKRLFLSIENDPWLGRPVKKLLLLLQIPLLKVSLLHNDFFESWSNPARIVINKLAMVDFDDEKHHFYIKARSIVLYLLENYDSDLGIFSRIQEVLTQLLEIQSDHYNDNVNSIIKKWDAQQIVTNDVAGRLADRSIPVVIADFISYQWLPILVSSYLKKGQDSSQWSQYLQALDMLLLIIGGNISDEFIDRDVILFIIKQGLEEAGQYNKKVIDEIESFLNDGDKGDKVLLDLDIIVKLLINGYAISDNSAIKKISKEAADTSMLANKAIAQRLKVNDYLIFKQNKKSTRLQFVWGSDGQNVFVFAGRTGQQEAVFNLSEVVSLLDNGQLSQTKDYELPLLERTLYEILGDVHDSMAKKTYYDHVTNLMMRREFENLFKRQLDKNREKGTGCALCLVDIDQFSLISDTCGYKAGDRYLSEIAGVIIKNLPSDAVISRYSFKQFIFLLPSHDQQSSQDISQSLRKAINEYGFSWEEKSFTLSASLGLVYVPEYNETELLLKAAATATTIAKELGHNRVHFMEYDALELNHRQGLQLWATKVEHMIQNSQLDIRCQRLQPMLDDTLSPHYEMLLLVKDDNGKMVPPAEFIEAAELYNKMAEVDRWVIRYIFKWFTEHPEQLQKMGGVSINLSGHSLNDVDFLDFVKNIFKEYSIPPELICFEITETVAISNMNYAINVVHAIKEIGCEFSLDDFGTGVSSYAYLKNLPVDYLKIDGIFIKDIVDSPVDQAMVKSINEIGHFLGMKTVAEFVENEEIIDVLKAIGVDYAQGYGVEKPFLMTEH